MRGRVVRIRRARAGADRFRGAVTGSQATRHPLLTQSLRAAAVILELTRGGQAPTVVIDRLDQEALPGSPGTTAGRCRLPGGIAARESSRRSSFCFSSEWALEAVLSEDGPHRGLEELDGISLRRAGTRTEP